MSSATHPSPRSLHWRAWSGLAQLGAGMLLALFLPGGFGWREGWAFFVVFLLSSAAVIVLNLLADLVIIALDARVRAG